MQYNKATVIRNCKNVSGRYQGVDFNINARHVVGLLDTAVKIGQKGTQRDAKALLRIMENKEWQVRAGGHSGGIGGGVHGADPNPHITLRVDNKGYHLRYKVVDKSIKLVEITS